MNCGTELGYENHRKRNEPACRGCKSWKAKHDAGTVKVASTKTKQQLAKCGTPSGHERHRKAGEPACRPCREARYAKQREYEDATRERNGLPPRKRRDPNAPKVSAEKVAKPEPALKPEPLPCGTRAAYNRHHLRGEPACDPCREASRLDAIDRRNKERGGPARQPSECGTTAGRAAHIYKREPVCPECREAFNAAARARYQARKAKS